MSLICHEDVKTFYRAAAPLLLRQEAYNNLPLGLLLRLRQRPELVERSLMLSLSESPLAEHQIDHEAQLAAVMTRPRQLVLGDGAIRLVPELAAWMFEHRPDLQGLVAPKSLAEAFADAWQILGGKSPKIDMSQRVYMLQQVTELPRPEGRYRLAGLGDLNLLLDWIEAFITESLPHERADREGIRAATLIQIDAGDIGLWEIRDHPVSMAARTRPTLTGTAVSLVYSPPEQRGHGYASACVAALSQAQLDAGRAFCCLFTDLANPTSNRIYQRIGYQPVGDVLVLDFSTSPA